MRNPISLLGISVAALVLAMPVLAGPKADPAQAARDLASRAQNDDWGYKFLEDMTTEQPRRFPGTPSMESAVKWAEAELKKAGFDKVHVESFPMTGWVRGEERAEVVAPNEQKLFVTALGNSVATPAQGVTAEIALFRSYADLLAAPAGSLAGKIAVVTQRMVRAEEGGGYGILSSTMRKSGASESAKRGALAYLIRSVGTDNHRIPHTGAMQYAEDAPKIPAGALSNPDADQLERLVARGPVRVHLVLTPTSVPQVTSWNVVADVKGREKPDEVVLIGGHFDAWDLGTGAIDDGAGVAISVGAARLIQKLPKHPKRTVRVILFGAEERDFSGDAYAEAHKAEVPKMIATAESDFGARPIYSFRVPASAQKSPFVISLANVLAPLGVYPSQDPARFSGSDFGGVNDAGAPPVSFRQRGTDYFDLHHTPDDTFDKVDPRELAQNIAVYAAFAYMAAESDDIDLRAPAPPAKP